MLLFKLPSQVRVRLQTKGVFHYLIEKGNWFVLPRLPNLKLHFIGAIPLISVCEREDQIYSCKKSMDHKVNNITKTNE